MQILESALYAEDLVAAREFYVRVLGLPEISFDPERSLFLRCDGGILIVFRASKTRIADAGIPPHGTTGAGHLAFWASRQEIERWKAKFAEQNVPVIQEMDWKNGARSIYFNDPAGNVLEFATPDLWGMA